MNPEPSLFTQLCNRISNVEDLSGDARRILANAQTRCAVYLSQESPNASLSSCIGYLVVPLVSSAIAWVAEPLSTGHILRRRGGTKDCQTQFNHPWDLPHDWYKPTEQTIFPKRAPSRASEHKTNQLGSTTV